MTIFVICDKNANYNPGDNSTDLCRVSLLVQIFGQNYYHHHNALGWGKTQLQKEIDFYLF